MLNFKIDDKLNNIDNDFYFAIIGIKVNKEVTYQHNDTTLNVMLRYSNTILDDINNGQKYQ